MALGIAFVVPTPSEARPNRSHGKVVKQKKTTEQLYAHRCQVYNDNRKYKRSKYRGWKVYCDKLAALKQKQNTTNTTQQNYQYLQNAYLTNEDDNSAAAFFRRDQMRMAGVNTNQVSEQVVRPANKKAPNRNTWFKSNPVAIAKNYEGLNARRNRQALKTLLTVDPARIPWCAAFANAMLTRAGYEGTGSLMARSFLNYGSVTYNPSEGDIAVFKRGRSKTAGHVGFYVGEQVINGKKYILTLGGNQSRSVTVAHIPASKLLGYRKI
jgi:uncharacterized protein (TIGR02594 family)